MELIKISENADGQSVVSARELHAFLEVQTEFPKWCERMFEYGFADNQDYTKVIVKNGDNSKGGRSTLIDYALTLDTAKQISMLQRSEKGKQARKYFIDCEKELNAGLALQASKLNALRTKLETLWAELSSTFQRLDHLTDRALTEITDELSALPAHAQIATPELTYQNVSDFFRSHDIILNDAQIAEWNRRCTRIAKQKKEMVGTHHYKTALFPLSVLQHALALYKAENR